MITTKTVCEVSVVVPVYNGQNLIWQALDSVRLTGIANAEIIVLDDGSTDQSWDFICRYSSQKVRAIRHSNIGLASTLNRGISIALGRYIARQDQDDLVLEGRINKQIDFLDANPEIAMCGTWAQIYDGDFPSERYHRHPSSNEALQLELLFDNPFVHSSMLIRAEVIRNVGGYCEDKSRQPPEDYELWSRIARNNRIANIPEVLTIYREVPASMSRSGESPFLVNVMRISSENIFHTLSTLYSREDCEALAEQYHIGGVVGYKSTLTKAKALRMLEVAAERIGGDRKDWSIEFNDSYIRMREHLRSRFWRPLIPKRLLGPARWLKDRLQLRWRLKW
jgi:glycosyltransferase involved in cell wall biosynthesis